MQGESIPVQVKCPFADLLATCHQVCEKMTQFTYECIIFLPPTHYIALCYRHCPCIHSYIQSRFGNIWLIKCPNHLNNFYNDCINDCPKTSKEVIYKAIQFSVLKKKINISTSWIPVQFGQGLLLDRSSWIKKKWIRFLILS